MKKMTLRIYTILSILCFCLVFAADRRLLLNDPDILVNRIDHLEETVKQQADIIKHLTSLMSTSVQQNSIGSTYIHWGRDDCTAQNTELVYTVLNRYFWPSPTVQRGDNVNCVIRNPNSHSASSVKIEKYGLVCYTAGGGSSETGGSPDFVCLPTNPKLKPTTGHDYGRIYGTEYSTDFWNGQHYHNEVPCAVCRSTNTSSSIMIPGRDSCSVGWKTEYHGYLGSSHHTYISGSSYICVDINHTSLAGGHRADGGKLLVNVKAVCGALQCPPYVNGTSLTCAVCSK